MKKMNVKRLLALALAVCLTLGNVSLAANAQETEEASVTSYAVFLENLKVLEGYASSYAAANNKDANELVLNFIRTGVARYNESLWPTLAGEEITGFTTYVEEQDEANDTTAMILRNLDEFTIPNGDQVDFGHMFGTLNIAYINVTYTADLGGWAGDICDLIYYSCNYGNVPEGTIEEMAAYILENCFGVDADNAFGMDDFYGDMDAFYLHSMLKQGKMLSALMEDYFTEELTNADRAAYFLNNRFSGLETREDVRQAVYDAYTSNVGLSVLEADREITDESDMRTASCYAFADYVYSLAEGRLEGKTDDDDDDDQDDTDDKDDGDDETQVGNEYFNVFSHTVSTLAPGITQEINYALNNDDKQVVYYLATIDITRDDVNVYANYKDNDASAGWGMQRVTDQMNAAQERHSDPEDTENYIENYTPVVGINADFYNMSNGKPSGALAMEGVIYNSASGRSFFAILDDGTPVIGTASEWDTYKDRVVEAVGGSYIIVKDGEPVVGNGVYYTEDGTRSCVGITEDGQLLFLVVDGRQEPFSAGATQEEIAQILIDAGCVIALHLDSGGSATYVSKAEGSDTVSVVNSPSDGYERSVSSSLMAVSTAVVSNEFSYAVVTSDYDYLTVDTSLTMTAVGVSASGNSAPIPESAVWQVSDETVGEITEDGVFTAIENGTVDVQLVAEGQVVGSKTLQVVVPDAIAFEKDNINAVYGVAVDLPVIVTYKGNSVAYNMYDICVYPYEDRAAWVEGVTFTGNESYGMRIIEVWAELDADEDVYDTMLVYMFKADEATFDFDTATGGDRTLAWNRVVTNATTTDDVTYQVTDPDEGMEVSYVFALDMRAIGIPEKLQNIIWMLPGGDQVDATAWDFLMQLAERVSVLTEVEVQVQIDEDLDVDISGLKVVNDYFYLKDAKVDEETNIVTITCGWVKQTQAIDTDKANPICILSGIKLTPKNDAAWDSEDQLNIVLTGDVSYDIYLRANALYNFAVIEENQETYGLIPFVNEDVLVNGAAEKGASFSDVYVEFNDTFVLDSTDRQGWVQIENHLYYFVDNVALEGGIYLLPGYDDPDNEYYYTFDADGSCAGTVSGLFELTDGLHFAINGTARYGWQTVTSASGDVQYYYFDKTTGAAVDGAQQIDGYNYTFTDYVLTRGEIVKNSRGYRYRWAGAWLATGWTDIDGETYYCAPTNEGYFVIGMSKLPGTDGTNWYVIFDEYGRWIKDSGFYDYNGYTYLLEDGFVIQWPGVVLVDGDYYYFNSLGRMVKDQTSYWISKGNGLLEEKAYDFDADGKIILSAGEGSGNSGETDADGNLKNGIVVEDDGEWYYYVDGIKTYAGLIQIDGDYYYVASSYKVMHDCTYWISRTNGLLAEGAYTFDSTGKIVLDTSGDTPATEPDETEAPTETEEPTDPGEVKNGIVVESDGEWYYYINGVKTYVGLILIDGDYYYVNTACKVMHDCTYWISKTNGLLEEKAYTFDSTGKIVLATGGDTSATEPEETEAPTDPVEVKNGIVVESNGEWYYYVNGIKTYAGLIQIDGDYYYVNTACKVLHDCTYWISKTNGLLEEKAYTFDSTGKIVLETSGDNGTTEPDDGSAAEPTDPVEVKNGIVVEDDGEWYYYVNGVKTYAGLIQIDGDYYYVASNYKVVHDCTYWISKTNGLLPEQSYTFNGAGKIVIKTTETEATEPDETEDPTDPVEVKNGIVVEDDGEWYYYVNGVKTYAGLIQIDGDYYYVNTACKVLRSCTYWISKTNGLLPEKAYTFDSNGKIVGITSSDNGSSAEPTEPEEVKDGIVEEDDGTWYYYVDGVKTYAGLIQIDGDYYYVNSLCKVVHDCSYWISKTNDLLPEQLYTFDADGKLVLE